MIEIEGPESGMTEKEAVQYIKVSYIAIHVYT
jgi:hypothetical protein